MAEEYPISTWPWLRDFIDRNFDKAVLLVMLGMWIAFVLHMIHHNMDRENIAWGREQASAIQGALLGMITGVAIGRKMASKATGQTVIPEPGTEEKPNG